MSRFPSQQQPLLFPIHQNSLVNHFWMINVQRRMYSFNGLEIAIPIPSTISPVNPIIINWINEKTLSNYIFERNCWLWSKVATFAFPSFACHSGTIRTSPPWSNLSSDHHECSFWSWASLWHYDEIVSHRMAKLN